MNPSEIPQHAMCNVLNKYYLHLYSIMPKIAYKEISFNWVTIGSIKVICRKHLKVLKSLNARSLHECLNLNLL